jgi:hypothetical protein
VLGGVVQAASRRGMDCSARSAQPSPVHREVP